MLFVASCNLMLLIVAGAESPLHFTVERRSSPSPIAKQLQHKVDGEAVLPGFYYVLPE